MGIDDRDRDHRIVQTVATQGNDRDREQDRRKRVKDDVHQEGDDIISPTSEISGRHPEEDPECARDSNRDQPDLE